MVVDMHMPMIDGPQLLRRKKCFQIFIRINGVPLACAQAFRQIFERCFSLYLICCFVSSFADCVAMINWQYAPSR